MSSSGSIATENTQVDEISSWRNRCYSDSHCVCRALGWLALAVVSFLVLLILYAHFRRDYLEKKYASLPLSNATWVSRVVAAQNNHSIPLVLFATESINLGESTRSLALADQLKNEFGDAIRVAIVHYGGVGRYKYEEVFKKSRHSHPVYRVCPCWETVEQLEIAMKIDRPSAIFDSDIIDAEMVRGRAETELELYSEIGPDVVVSGISFASRIATQVAGIPLVTVFPCFLFPLHQKFGSLASWWGVPSIIRFLHRVVVWMLRHVWLLSSIFTELFLESFAVRPTVLGIGDAMRGDLNLVTDLPAFVGVSEEELWDIMGSSFHYVGLLSASFDLPIPEEVRLRIGEVKSVGKKVVAFAMGSTGEPRIVEEILRQFDQAFQESRAEVTDIGLIVSPTLHLVGDLGLSDKILQTDILNMKQMNKLADVGVFHGGQGTVQTAIEAGLPFVGVPMGQPDQRLNIQKVALAGGALLLEHDDVLRIDFHVVDAVHEVFASYDSFHQAILTRSEQSRQLDAVEEASRLIMSYFFSLGFER